HTTRSLLPKLGVVTVGSTVMARWARCGGYPPNEASPSHSRIVAHATGFHCLRAVRFQGLLLSEAYAAGPSSAHVRLDRPSSTKFNSRDAFWMAAHRSGWEKSRLGCGCTGHPACLGKPMTSMPA